MYVLRQKEPIITSHDIVKLNLCSAIKEISQEPVDVYIPYSKSSDGSIQLKMTPLQSYLQRPEELHTCSWYDYLRLYKVVALIRKRQKIDVFDPSKHLTDDFTLFERYRLNEDHADYEKKMVIRRDSPAVVQYTGYSLKPTRRRSTPEQHEQYAMSVLVMFSPFSHPNELLSENGSSIYESYFESLFLDDQLTIRPNKISASGLDFLRNHEDRWEAKFLSQDQARKHKEEMRKLADTIQLDEPDSLPFHYYSDDSLESDSDYDIGDIAHMADFIHEDNFDFQTPGESTDDLKASDIPMVIPSTTACWLPRIGQTNDIIKGFKKGDPSSLLTNNITYPDFHLIKNESVTVTEIGELATASINSLRDHTHNDVAYESLRQKKLAAQHNYVVKFFVNSNTPAVEIPLFASLRQIKNIFMYSEDQTRAFRIGAAGLLQSIVDNLHDIDYTDIYVQSRQAALLVQGLAGSGKSYVINGWRALAVSWGHPSAVLTLALTGKAASIINGRTIASMSFKKEKSFAPVKLLCIDEVFYIFLPQAHCLFMIILLLRCIWSGGVIYQTWRFYSNETVFTTICYLVGSVLCWLVILLSCLQ